MNSRTYEKKSASDIHVPIYENDQGIILTYKQTKVDSEKVLSVTYSMYIRGERQQALLTRLTSSLSFKMGSNHPNP